MADKNTPNLYQRLQAVASEVGQVDATGKNQYKAAAMSVEDVENAIRPHLATHGVITRWSYEALTDIGEGKLWLAKLRITVVNADDPTDAFEDMWADIGTNPMAATSFCVKGYYKRLFHLASGEDEGKPGVRGEQATSRAQHHDVAPKPATPQTETQSTLDDDQPAPLTVRQSLVSLKTKLGLGTEDDFGDLTVADARSEWRRLTNLSKARQA